MKGKRAFDAYIKGTTTEDIQKTRDEVSSTNVETIRSLAPIIDLCSILTSISVLWEAQT